MLFTQKSYLVLLCLIFGTQLILSNERHKRFLIFPRQAPTRHQFIAGIGIPADLALESLTIGYVLKAMYYLPYNATVYRENAFFPEYATMKNTYLKQRKMKDADLNTSPLRWAIYKFIADRLENYGLNGQECVKKAICEARALSFDPHLNIFAELMHILLSPRTSHDSDSTKVMDYFKAEGLGHKGEEYCKIYKCNLSLLKLFSKVFRVL